MTAKKKIKLSDDFFLVPETGRNVSGGRSTTDAEAMDVILGVSERGRTPTGAQQSSKPSIAKSSVRRLPTRASMSKRSATSQPPDPGRVRSSPGLRETSRDESPGMTKALFSLAFEMTSLLMRTMTLPLRILASTAGRSRSSSRSD